MKFKASLVVAALSSFAINITTAQNPIIKDIFTADPAPIVYHDTVFLYTGHDTASVTATNYKMPDWHLFSSTDMVNWKDYGALLSPHTFSWATG